MDGNVMLSTELDTRPVTQSLSNLKKKIVDVFKGADVKTLSASLKAINAEIKTTEAQARKAQAALDALMRGDKDPQIIKVINADLKSAQTELSKVQTKLNDLLNGRTEPKATKPWLAELKTIEKEYAQLEKKANTAAAVLAKDLQPKHPSGYTKLTDKQRDDLRAELADYDTRMSALQTRADELRQVIGAARMYPELTNEAKRYQQQIDELQKKIQALQLAEQDVRQNPALTVEAQQYQQQINEAKVRLGELKAKQEELGASAQRVGAITRLQQNSVVTGFQRIERRIMGLVKRVFFFTLITKALRAVRSQVSALIANDSQLASSLAIVKGNLATAFGTIWVAVLPALRALINFLAKATSYLIAFISWLTGKSFKTGQKAMQSISTSAGSAAGNTGKIGKAAKKAAKALNRMLLPFDQMNILSKDTADNTGNTGSGGGGAGGGAGGVNPSGITWPKEMDGVMKKFEKFKDLILLIGAAFAAWKLTNIIAKLLEITDAFKKFKLFAGLAALIAGIALLVRGIRDLKKNGPTVENICDIIAGAFLTVGGAILLFTGSTGLGAIIIAIGLVVLAFKNLYEHFKPFRKYIDGALKRIKKAFGKGKLEGFKQIGKEIILGILKGIIFVVKKIGSWIKKHVVEPIKKWFKKKFGINSPAKEMLDIGKNIALGILEGILTPFKKIGGWINEHVLTPIKEALFGDGEDNEGFFVNIGAKFSDTKEEIKEKWENLTADVKDKVAEMKANVGQKWNDIKTDWTNLTSNVVDKVADMKANISQKWDDIKKSWTDIVDNVKAKTVDMKANIAQKWDDIKKSWTDIVGNIKAKTADMKAKVAQKWDDLKSDWHKIIDNVKTKVADLKAKVAQKWDDLKDDWNKLVGNVKEKVADMKAKVASKWKDKGLKDKWKDITKHIKNKTAKMKATVASKWKDLKKSWTNLMSNFGDKTAYISLKFSAAAQDLKNWINNNVIAKINGAFDKVPILRNHKLNYLAQGAVIPANKEFLAVLGDQKHGVNIETPLQTMIDAFNTALQQNGYNGNQSVNVYLQGDAKQLFKVVRIEANNYTKSTGKAAFNL